MSGPFSFTKELSAGQCAGIDRALRTHGIEIADEKFNRLCTVVEGDLTWYLNNRNWKKASRADALTDIVKLQDAIKRLSQTSNEILSSAAPHTLTQRRFDATKLCWGLQDVLYSQWSNETEDLPLTGAHETTPHHTLYGLALLLVGEACELALSDAPPLCADGKQDVVSLSVANNGRPKKEIERYLTQCLAKAFEEATGRRATDTESGPFDDFLSVCLEVVNLKKGQAPNRKRIRAALCDPLKHVPKPPKKK